MRETERERGRDTGRGRSRLQAGADVELDPGSPGSCPGPKAGAKPLSHPVVFLIWDSLPRAILSSVVFLIWDYLPRTMRTFCSFSHKVQLLFTGA